jgi:ATP-dependent NAD(P)H-hydrate dehydratase
MSLSMGTCGHHLQHRGHMWAASPAFRRQLVLLRSLAPTCVDGGRASPSSLQVHAMSAASAAAGPVYEADAEAVVRRITPPLDRARHKGQAGE